MISYLYLYINTIVNIVGYTRLHKKVSAELIVILQLKRILAINIAWEVGLKNWIKNAYR